MSGAEDIFSTPAMDAVFAPAAHVARLLDFEAALARAEARAGVIPADAAAAIGAACRVERFDVGAIFREAGVAGTAAIPLVRRLTEAVEGDARGYVHWGATSQDAIDTATVLQVRDGLELLLTDLLGLGDACAALAEAHRRTPMAGRTLLQQALPITFGLKAARWLGLATRSVERLRRLRAEALAVQLGGAAGTLASLGDRGPAVVDALAAELGLAAPELPWHAERDRPADAAAALGVVAGGAAKIARDVALLVQTEVGEAAEGAAPGKGGSSTLPHKRNPVDATMALGAARLAIGQVPVILAAMEQEHERAAGGWQAEWVALPALFRYTAGAVARTRAAVAGLELHPERMRANLDLTDGQLMAESLTMALAPKLGRHAAYRLAQAATRRAAQTGSSLRQAAAEDNQIAATLPPAALDAALDPASYLGSAGTFVDRALDQFRRVRDVPSR